MGVFSVYGLSLQVIPHTDSPLLAGMFADARQESVGGEPVKIASPEHLAVAALTRFRYRDAERVVLLLPILDRKKFLALVRRYDADGRLRRNLNILRRGAGFSL